MVILEIFEGELVPISLDLDHLKSLKRTNFVPTWTVKLELYRFYVLIVLVTTVKILWVNNILKIKKFKYL